MKPEINGKRCLVVGANNFLGKELMKRLSEKNDVLGIYNKNTDNFIPGLKYIQVKELAGLNDSYDHVFLVSAYVPDKTQPLHPGLLKEANEELPGYICAKFKKARIILSSSVSVYEGVNEVITEKTATAPVSPYALSKQASERIVSRHSGYSILRIASMYGAGMRLSTYLPMVISDAISKGEIRIFGNGSRKQNYIHVSDVAAMMIGAAAVANNDVYLAVARDSYTNLEIAEIVCNKINNVKITFKGEDNSRSCLYDASLTYYRIGCEPQKTIEAGISDLIEWQRKK